MTLFFNWGHSIITFAFKGEGVPSKCECMRTGGGRVSYRCERFHINVFD